MFELKDSIGRQLFETISISLVCDDCMKTDNPENCTHKLAEMPRWLSSAKMEVVKSLLSEDPAMLLRESMGVGADSNTKAFHATDINNFLKRPPVEIYRDSIDYNHARNTNHIVIAVDPSGGGSSAFGVCSMVQKPNGSVVVSGQFPSLSPSNSWLRMRVVNTYASGAWHEWRMNSGSMNGSTLSVKSAVNPVSRLQKYSFSSGSRRSAKSMAARLQTTPSAEHSMLAMDVQSLIASRVASVPSPYVCLNT